MSKIRMPKCPFCGFPYDKAGDLASLAIYGWEEQKIVKCPHCDRKYIVTVKIMFYGKKVKA